LEIKKNGKIYRGPIEKYERKLEREARIERNIKKSFSLLSIKKCE
jgi:hypothetical protein